MPKIAIYKQTSTERRLDGDFLDNKLSSGGDEEFRRVLAHMTEYFSSLFCTLVLELQLKRRRCVLCKCKRSFDQCNVLPRVDEERQVVPADCNATTSGRGNDRLHLIVMY